MQETTKPGVFLEILPKEILANVLQDFIPEDLANLSASNAVTRALLENDLLWQAKFKTHFPHIRIDSAPTSYRSLFIATYKTQYEGLSSKVKRLFSIVKQGDVYSLNQTEFSMDDLFYRDARNYRVIDWVAEKNNRIILNIIYFRVKLFFSTNDIVDPRKRDGQGNSLLHWVAMCDRVDEVNTCLLSGTPIDIRNIAEETPLFLAIKFGCLELVKFLYVEKAAEPQLLLNPTRYSSSGRILGLAAFYGHKEIVEFSLDIKKKEGKLISKDLEVVFLNSCMSGHADIASLVIGKVQSNLDTLWQLNDVLANVVKGNHVAIAELLSKYGYTFYDSKFWLLEVAARENAKEMVEWLLQKGVKANSEAFKSSLQNNFEEIARLLLESAINSNNFSQSDFIWAIFDSIKNISLDFLKFVIKKLSIKSCLVNRRSIVDCHIVSGASLLHMAALYDRVEIVNYLINSGADLNATCKISKFYDDSWNEDRYIDSQKYNYTPLHCAIEFKSSKAASALLKAGAKSSMEYKLSDSRTFSTYVTATDLGLNSSVKEIKDTFITNEKTKLIAEVKNYAETREKDGRPYKKSVTLFGHTFNFGYSMTDKLAAGDKFIDFLAEKVERSSLTEYLGALNDGDLGKIYQAAVKLKL